MKFAFYVWIFFYQPCPFKISMPIPLLRKVFTQYYYLIYKWLPSPLVVSHLLQNWEKVTNKTLSKPLLFFLFHVLRQVFFSQNNSRKMKIEKWEKSWIFFFFCFHSRSPLFSASKQENINEKNKKTNNNNKKEARIWKKKHEE